MSKNIEQYTKMVPNMESKWTNMEFSFDLVPVRTGPLPLCFFARTPCAGLVRAVCAPCAHLARRSRPLRRLLLCAPCAGLVRALCGAVRQLWLNLSWRTARTLFLVRRLVRALCVHGALAGRLALRLAGRASEYKVTPLCTKRCLLVQSRTS